MSDEADKVNRHSTDRNNENSVGSFAENLAKRLRQLRGARSQAEFARELGVAANSLARYERGEMMPSAEFLANVVRLTGADPLIIMGIKAAELGNLPLSPLLGRRPNIGEDSGREFRPSGAVPESAGDRAAKAGRAAPVLPDRDVLASVVEALEETPRYRELDPMSKARAVVALYEIVQLTEVEPRAALKESAA